MVLEILPFIILLIVFVGVFVQLIPFAKVILSDAKVVSGAYIFIKKRGCGQSNSQNYIYCLSPCDTAFIFVLSRFNPTVCDFLILLQSVTFSS